jgi:glyoxylase-like metal-dependent hydrolase (beta-lactamase superfamily II)
MPVRVEVWIPIASLGSVNVYVFTDGSETVLVDSGMFTARSVHSLLRGLRRAGVDPRSVSRIVVTHYHVDHLTGAAILAEAFGAEVMLGRRDIEAVLEKGVEEYVGEAIEVFRASGVPGHVIEEIVRYQPGLRMVEAYRALSELEPTPLSEGSAVELPGHGAYEVIEAPGHTPGHIVLVSRYRREALVGDTILPGITPHVSLHSLDTDPLGDYIRTLKRLEGELKGYTALPGHREPLPDASARARELLEFLAGVFEGIESRYRVQERSYHRRVERVQVRVHDIHQLVRDRRSEPIVVLEPEGEPVSKIAEELWRIVRSGKRINILIGSREGIPLGIYRFADLVIDIAPGITISTEYAAASALIAFATLLHDRLGELGDENTGGSSGW